MHPGGVCRYQDEAEASVDKALTTSLYRSIAEIYQKNTPGSDEVELYLRKSLDVDPNDKKSAFHLERLLRSESRWDDLITFINQRIETAADDFSKVDAIMDLGRLYGKQLDDREAMKDCFRRILDDDPGNQLALRALADAY